MSNSNAEELEEAHKCLRQLRDLLTDNKGLQNFPINYDEQFLLSFVRARKYNADAAYKTVLRYYHVRINNPIIFKSAYPGFGQIKYIIDNNIVSKLKFRNREERDVFTVDCDRWDPNEMSFDILLSAMILLVEELLNTTADAHINGITTFFHLKNFTFSHFKQLSLNRLKLTLELWRGSFPMRLKNIYMFQQPSLFTVILAMVNPFLTHKIRSRLLFLGNDLISLDKEISLKCLPKRFGGELNDDDAFDEEFKLHLYKKDSYYKQLCAT